MIINHNFSALRTVNTYQKTNVAYQKSMEKLSSGMRINRAADDAAGLAISEGMRAQIRGLMQAQRNARDAHSMIGTGEGALAGAMDMLQRMRELAIQSLNDTNTEADRLLMQEEFRQLQLGIDGIPGEANWSGYPIIDEYSSAYHDIQGNHYFAPNEIVKITNGYNDDLTVIVDGQEYSIQIPEGEYIPVEVLIDTIDDLFQEVYPDLIINLTEERTVTLESANVPNLEAIKGGASFLFYEYSLGTPPGMIIGFTTYEGDDVIPVVAGKSDVLSLFVGNTEHTITFPPGNYTRTQVIEEINKSLHNVSAQAVLYGDNKIAITSDEYMITGIGGNMIEIDGLTSVLYDNRKSGEIIKTNAEITGRKQLEDQILFTKDNHELKITHKNQEYTIDFLPKGQLSVKLSKENVLEMIQKELEGTRLEISLSAGRLKIEDPYYGNDSNLSIDTRSTAYEDLFVDVRVSQGSIINNSGADIPGKIEGYAGLQEPVKIDHTNSTFSGKINGEDFEIQLEEKEYSLEDLRDELNRKAEEVGLDLTFSISDDLYTNQHGFKKLIVERPYENSDKLEIHPSPLLNGYRFLQPTSYEARGTTTITYPPEGQAGLPKIEETPAYWKSARPFSNELEINEKNNKLTFNIQGKNGIAETKEITLVAGTYTTAEAFVTAHKAAFEQAGVELSVTQDNVLRYETIEVGETVRLSGFTGSAYPYVLGALREEELVNPTSQSTQLAPSIVGSGYLVYPTVIDESLTMTVQYTYEGQDLSLVFELPKGTYESAEEIQDILNNSLRLQLEPDLSPDSLVFKVQEGSFVLTSKQVGSDYQLSSPQGNLAEKLFKEQVWKNRPFPTEQGVTIDRPTYLSGRRPIIDKEITISPNINDTLSFSLYVGGKYGEEKNISFQLDSGKYSATSIANHINEQLKIALAENGIPENLVKAQVGLPDHAIAELEENKEVDSSLLLEMGAKSLSFYIYQGEDGERHTEKYIIDKMRGSAAYDLFYDSEGQPVPTYTVGVADISNGVLIEDGKNDTLIFDLDDEEIKVTLPAGDYTQKTLIDELNLHLQQAGGEVIASVYEGKLKLSTDKVGQKTLDGMRGNARESLFFNESKRETDDRWHFQVGANTGQAIQFDKIRMSARMMGVNTIMIDDPGRANKALERIEEALNYLSTERGRIGAMMNRLEHAGALATINSENLVASESVIRDTDFAKMKMKEIKEQILRSSNQMIMVHAFAQPEKILTLLGSR